MAHKRKSAFFSATQEAQKQAEKQQKDMDSESNNVISESQQIEIKADTINGTTEKQDSEKTVDTEDPIFLAVMQNVEVAELQNRITDKPQDVQTQEQDNIKAESPKPAITAKLESRKEGKRKNTKTQEPQSVIEVTNEDKPTEKITLYLTWKQLDKLDQMALEYKRRTRQRTDHNKLMRMMVDKFGLDDLI